MIKAVIFPEWILSDMLMIENFQELFFPIVDPGDGSFIYSIL